MVPKRMKLPTKRVLGLVLLNCAIAVLAVGYGYVARAKKIFPHYAILELVQFVKGDPDGNATSLWQKLMNDAGVSPERHLCDYPPFAARRTSSVAVDGVKSRREMPLYFVGEGHEAGLRAYFGNFDFDNGPWGGVLIDKSSQIVHRWEWESNFVYGIHLFPDGSVVFAEENGSLTKIDDQSAVVWTNDGAFHHCITPADANSFWTFAGHYKDRIHDMVRVSLEDGEIVQTIGMNDIRGNKRAHTHF